ncbi:MAG: PIN domain-containing protein [Gemmatimonadales bacterium]
MPGALYVETSAALRAVVEAGTTPALEQRIAAATVLITSRLSLVEAARAMLRLRALGRVAEERLADAGRQLDALWARCDVWELSRGVCDLASEVAPAKLLRTLDALHLATYLLARRRFAGIELETTDERLKDAAGAAPSAL